MSSDIGRLSRRLGATTDQSIASSMDVSLKEAIVENLTLGERLEAEAEAESPESLLKRMLSIKSVVTTSSSFAQKHLCRIYQIRSRFRVAFGRVKYGTGGHFFTLRNFKLHANEIKELEINPSELIIGMSHTLAVLHWHTKIDAMDIEFVIGSSPAAGKKLWNSEYGEGDATGQRLASNLLLDFRWLKPTAWVYW
ncbi:hypothetical protein B0T24DRAFT_591545 [Lasiosphaeria ovina]|uniref:Uncharacterized protein n=1 Tax=Lasiosphaeria ovina TaxID=92902 RepID=A0AAE0KG41_9PEZI|nr:hypothetical protein B0T24DRAFT_591545 [Lasiosphaeria ovina]